MQETDGVEPSTGRARAFASPKKAVVSTASSMALLQTFAIFVMQMLGAVNVDEWKEISLLIVVATSLHTRRHGFNPRLQPLLQRQFFRNVAWSGSIVRWN